MAREQILLVEDEDDIIEVIRYNLEKEGYRVRAVPDAEGAERELASNVPDLLVLDLMLPGMGGLDLCRALKADPRTASLPIVMLTARTEESDIVSGLELGADDYITKPFSPRVLIARIRAVLRRKREIKRAGDETLKVHDLLIAPKRHEVRYRGKPIELTATEFKLLHFLARHPGWVFTRDQIVDNVRGEDYAVTDRAVDVQVVGLRRKLGAAAAYIETVRGVGYRFKE